MNQTWKVPRRLWRQAHNSLPPSPPPSAESAASPRPGCSLAGTHRTLTADTAGNVCLAPEATGSLLSDLRRPQRKEQKPNINLTWWFGDLGFNLGKDLLLCVVSVCVPTFCRSIKRWIERHSFAVILPQHFPIDLIGAWVHSQHQVEMRPQALGNPPETLLEVGPELRGPLWVRFHQSFESGSQLGLERRGYADFSSFNVLHQLLPAILWYLK